MARTLTKKSEPHKKVTAFQRLELRKSFCLSSFNFQFPHTIEANYGPPPLLFVEEEAAAARKYNNNAPFKTDVIINKLFSPLDQDDMMMVLSFGRKQGS